MLRPMTLDDVPAVATLAHDAFRELDRAFGLPTNDEPVDPARHPRYSHLVETDPGGAWVDEHGGAIRAAALALVREGVWGLSLLVVDPAHQSAGLGRSLLEATLSYGTGARGGIILASGDARAIRAYHRAGFDLRPAVDATGEVRVRPARDPAVRALRWPADRDLVDGVGRHLRGAGHSRDVPTWLEMGAHVEVHDDGGFVVHLEGTVFAVAARAPATAAALLRAALTETPDGKSAEVMYIGAGQEWAVQTVLEAGLSLRPGGPVMTRGELGALAPYLPSGAYL